MNVRRSAVLLLVLVGVSVEAAAGTLQQAYDAALGNDSTLQVARAELEADSAGVPIARAGLLPGLSATLSTSRVNGTRLYKPATGASISTPLDYEAPAAGLSLRMPLINVDAWRRLGQATAQRSLADSVFSTHQEDMLERLAGAYLQYRLSANSLASAQNLMEAAQTQLQWARRRFERGEGAQTEQAGAEAQLDLTQAQLRGAEDLADTAGLMLRQMTGLDWPRPPAEANRPRNIEAGIAPLADVLKRVDETHPELEAHRRAVVVARAAVARQRAGHYPRLDLVAGVSKATNDSVSTLDQEIRQRSVGVQLSMPIFNGGGISASVDQAAANLRKAERELAARQQSMALEVTRLHAAAQTGLAKTRALQRILAAATEELEAARLGVRAGINSESDVATARTREANAYQDFTQAFHDLQYARFKLWVRTGVSPQQAIADLEDALTR